MNDHGPVDYAAIRADYEFFLASSSETSAQITALAPHMRWLAGRAERRMLDFGCGTGAFAEALLRAAPPERPKPRLRLVEPVAPHRAEARARLTPLAELAPEGDLGDERFDLILANHSLYYVQDPTAALTDLARRLAPGGRLILALLGRDNALAEIWRDGYAAAGAAFPFFLADDAIATLGAGALRAEPVSYRIAFADSAEARWRIARFLFGAEAEARFGPELIALFDRRRRGAEIVIKTRYDHLVLGA